jgi:hypothetical protein
MLRPLLSSRIKIIVSIGRAVSKAPPSQDKEAFKSDCMGVANSLYLVSKWCRELTARREAVRILKGNAVRDGVWNGRIMAVPSEFLMSIGEEETAPVREDRARYLRGGG